MPKLFDPSAPSADARAALSARYLPVLAALMNPGTPPDLRTGVTLSLCSDILSSLDSYTRLPIPERPMEIEGLVDAQIVDKVTFIVNSSRATAEDREFVASFALWRSAVLTVESKNAGRVEALLWAFAKLAPVAQTFAEQARDLATLGTFLSAEWEVDLQAAPSYSEAAAIAYRAAFERVAMPNALRNFENPAAAYVPKRGGEPSRVGSWMQDFEAQKEREQEP